MRRSILLFLGLLLSWTGSHGDPLEPETTLVGGTSHERQLVQGVLDQFSDLGLELPVIEIRLHQDFVDCDGNSGTFSSNTSLWVVNLCRVDAWVVRHELGHAWETWNLTESERDLLLDMWELDSWSGAETPWRFRGAEHAADTIAWGLSEDPIGCYAAGGAIAARVDSFRHLVKLDPPRLACGAGSAMRTSSGGPPAPRIHWVRVW